METPGFDEEQKEKLWSDASSHQDPGKNGLPREAGM